ncbi:MAG TPA: 2-amino-4-hydroxy-6-hydroxymethyldihydropteridine diphosphokinase [bacterium]|nr:2-amino-4-hydroxy-6-hydroxymethyldihydropteridine diphosphokinase [bacterium]
MGDLIHLKGLKVRCIIGIFEWERKRKQDVILDLSFPTSVARAAQRDRIQDALDYKRIAKSTIAFVEKSSYQLVETLAERLAQHLIEKFGLPRVRLSVSKPGAIRGSQNVGVEILREATAENTERIYFSFGSNIEPLFNIKRGLESLDRRFGISSLSHLYETSPVGGRRGQPSFLNLMASVGTSLDPISIRQWIIATEKKAGRKRSKDRNGARTLDIDMVLWGNLSGHFEGFTLPHPDITQKAFVLFPLLEIAPNLVIPGLERPVVELAHSFKAKDQKIRQIRNLPPSTFRTWPVIKGWEAMK